MKPKNSDEWLRKRFLEFNRKFFNRKLPISTRVYWVTRFKAPKEHALGCVFVYEDNRGKSHFVIHLSRRIERVGLALTLTTLLHEMAHIAVWETDNSANSHGQVWIKEMRRLASVGAFDLLW